MLPIFISSVFELCFGHLTADGSVAPTSIAGRFRRTSSATSFGQLYYLGESVLARVRSMQPWDERGACALESSSSVLIRSLKWSIDSTPHQSKSSRVKVYANDVHGWNNELPTYCERSAFARVHNWRQGHSRSFRDDSRESNSLRLGTARCIVDTSREPYDSTKPFRNYYARLRNRQLPGLDRHGFTICAETKT